MIYIQINGKNNEFFQKSLTLMIRMELKQNKTKKKRRISLFASAKVVLLGQSYSFTDESRHREVRTKCKSSFTKGKNERLN